MGEGFDENMKGLHTTSHTTVKGYYQRMQNPEGKESYIRGMGYVNRVAWPDSGPTDWGIPLGRMINNSRCRERDGGDKQCVYNTILLVSGNHWHSG